MTARILVVDDVAANAAFLEARLRSDYYDVLLAASGREALDIVADGLVDLVLLDVMMPGMDGFEVCERLKGDPDTAQIPVVMVTTLGRPSDRARGLRAGADDFLTKPVNDLQLMARVRSLLRLKMMTDELRVRAEVAEDLALETDDAERHQKGMVLLVGTDPALARSLPDMLREIADVTVSDEPMPAPGEAANPYELVIINSDLSGEDPLRLCARLRSSQHTRFTPLLLIVGPGEEDLVSRALELGVNDYILRPTEPNELIARCKTQLRRKRYNDRLRSGMRRTAELAVTDPLTGLHNRRYLEARMKRLMERSIAAKQPLSVILADIDRFKRINDAHGHAIGDTVIRECADRLRGGVRSTDLVCRVGGDEFVIVLPDAEAATARDMAERLRKRIAASCFDVGTGVSPLRVTMSVGVSAGFAAGEQPDRLLARADQALYEAKNEGRNRVAVKTVP